MIKRDLWFACWLALVAAAAYAQEEGMTLPEAKAHYMIEVTKHIVWPNDAELDRFRVAIVADDEDLARAFQARESERVRDKRFEFVFLDHGDFDPDAFSHIFLEHRFRSLNDTLFERVGSTLIIVDGRVDREKQMLSLEGLSRHLTVRLNRGNLTARGFRPSISLLRFAGTKDDLTQELRESQARLDSLVDEVEAKETRVEDLNRVLGEKTAELEVARTVLSDNEGELDSARRRLEALSEEIRLAQGEVDQYRAEIREQQALFSKKQQEIAAKEQAIADLQLQIDQNQRVVDRQLSEIAMQRKALADRNETILAQRELMFVIGGALVVFSVLVYFLHRSNGLRKRANRELAALNARLYELATVDGLSGLFNRRHFLEMAQKQLRRELRKGNEMAALMMDVDHFKEINDNYGHAAGDQVIKAVARVLKENLREYDIVGRLGGEEYAMMLADCDLPRSLEIAGRLCDQIAELEVPFGDENIDVAISIGVGVARPEDRDIEQVLRRADTALYEAKAQGRNRVVAHGMEATG